MAIRLHIRDVNQPCEYLDKKINDVSVDVCKMLWRLNNRNFTMSVEAFKPARKNTFVSCNEDDVITRGSRIRVVVVFGSVLETKLVFDQIRNSPRTNNESFVWTKLFTSTVPKTIRDQQQFSYVSVNSFVYLHAKTKVINFGQECFCFSVC